MEAGRARGRQGAALACQLAATAVRHPPRLTLSRKPLSCETIMEEMSAGRGRVGGCAAHEPTACTRALLPAVAAAEAGALLPPS